MLPGGKTVLVACSMLRDELEKSLSDVGTAMEIVWMEKGLHEKPEGLRVALQEKIDALPDADLIVLAYCLCGNAVLGLKSDRATLIIPKFDDCIRLLRSTGPDGKPEVNPRCLYLTRGWVDSDKFLLDQIFQYEEKYGPRKAARITESLLGSYTGVCLIDTGAYAIGDYDERVQEASNRLKLEFSIVTGTRRVLDKLASGEFDREFCVIPPGRAVTLGDFDGRPL